MCNLTSRRSSIWVEVYLFLLGLEAISGSLDEYVLTHVPGPVRTKLMCSNKFYVKQIGNRETNCWTISKTLFHVSVQLISRIEDYMIAYLKWRIIILSVPRDLERATIADRFLKSYLKL